MTTWRLDLSEMVSMGEDQFYQIKSLTGLDSMFSLPVLEHQLVMYVTADGRDPFEQPFDLSKVPVVTREQADAEDRTKKLTTATPTLKAPSTGPKPASRGGAEAAASATAAAQKYAAQLQTIPELASYGGVLKSSSVIELTESETEYVVSAVKHLFKDHVVLEFQIKNTLPETVLIDVSVVSTPADEDGDVQLEEDFIIPAPKLITNEPGTVYVSFKRLETESQFVAATFTNVLKFTSKEIDPTTGEPEEGDGYDDEYQVEDLELTGADYVVPVYAGSFDNVWEQAGAGEEATETLQLSNTKSIAGTSILSKPSINLPLRNNSIYHIESSLVSISQWLTFHFVQMPRSNSRRPSPCNPWKALKSRCPPRHTRSSCTARQSPVARWLQWYGWRFRQRMALQ